jgi:hypothetical protein
MKRFFFTHRKVRLDSVPTFAEIMFPFMVVIECDNRIIAQGIYLGNLTVVTNSPLCDGSNYRIHFLSSGIISRAVITHREEELQMCYLECFMGPTLSFLRSIHRPIPKDEFVFEVTLMPKLSITMAVAGEKPRFNDDGVVTLRHTPSSGTALVSRHGELMGMLVAEVSDQREYAVCVDLQDILLCAHGS